MTTAEKNLRALEAGDRGFRPSTFEGRPDFTEVVFSPDTKTPKWILDLASAGMAEEKARRTA